MPVPGGGVGRIQRIGLVSWCLYDWANSAFPTIITTFVFSVYFTQMVASDPIQGLHNGAMPLLQQRSSW
jgi:UMF1 family MFS transporter